MGMMASSMAASIPAQFLFCSLSFLIIIILPYCSCLSSPVRELNSDSLQQFTKGPEVRLLFFHSQKGASEVPSVKSFLKEFSESAKQLGAYNVLLGTLDCSSSPVDYYCSEERVDRMVYGFRDGSEKIGLPTDTLEDNDAIVASALHLSLIHLVPIVQTQMERRGLEKRCKGRCDIVFSYHHSLGTYEHRAFMEVAFRYTSTHMFAMTTSRSAYSGLPSAIRDENDTPALWLLQCSHLVVGKEDECVPSGFQKQISINNVVDFVDALRMPLWLELPDGSSDLNASPYDSSGYPLVVLFYEVELEKVRQTAQVIGRAFRGNVGVVIVKMKDISPELLESIGLHPDDIVTPSVAFKPQKKKVSGLLNVYDDASSFVWDQLKTYLHSEEMEESVHFTTPHAQEDRQLYSQAELLQDDEVAHDLPPPAHTVPSGGNTVETSDAQYIPPATPEVIKEIKECGNDTLFMVVYYLEWDAYSRGVLRLVNGIVNSSEVPQPTIFFRVNCFDWPKLCENSSAVIVFHRKDDLIDWEYRYSMDVKSVLHTIKMFHTKSPVVLKTENDYLKYFEYDKRQNASLVLADSTENNDEMALEMAKKLNGFYIILHCKSEAAEKFSTVFNCTLPCVGLLKGNDKHQPFVKLNNNILQMLKTEELLRKIRTEALHLFDELTWSNFPAYDSLHIPIVILMTPLPTPSNNNQQIFIKLAKQQKTDQRMAFVWISSTTEVGSSVLTTYNLPKESDSVLILNRTGGQYYTFKTVQEYVNHIEEAKPLTTTGSISTGSWKPVHPGFDYLRFMDQEEDDDSRMFDRKSRVREMNQNNENNVMEDGNHNMHTEL